jgi:hypothetical protein
LADTFLPGRFGVSDLEAKGSNNQRRVMKGIIRRLRPSPAMIVACIALLFAMTGAGYAAGMLGPNTVGTKQLKKNAVISTKVKNRSLLAVDFKAGQLPRGAQGPQGAQGSQGVQGPPGPFPSGDLPSGNTVRGTYALARYDTGAADNGFIADSIQFGFRFAIAPAPTVVPVGTVAPPQCPGTPEVPEAAPGNLCVYEGAQGSSTGLAVYNVAAAPGANRSGAVIRIFSSADNSTFYSIGSWAANPGTAAAPARPSAGTFTEK